MVKNIRLLEHFNYEKKHYTRIMLDSIFIFEHIF